MPTVAVNNTNHAETVHTPRSVRKMHKQVDLMLREVCAPTKANPWVRKYTPHCTEVTRILGPAQASQIADERVRQISRRWLKADQFIKDENGEEIVNAAGDGLVTESVRIRIPRDSWMRRDFKHKR